MPSCVTLMLLTFLVTSSCVTAGWRWKRTTGRWIGCYRWPVARTWSTSTTFSSQRQGGRWVTTTYGCPSSRARGGLPSPASSGSRASCACFWPPWWLTQCSIKQAETQVLFKTLSLPLYRLYLKGKNPPNWNKTDVMFKAWRGIAVYRRACMSGGEQWL